MRELQDKRLAGWTIVEHQTNNKNVVGRIEQSALNGDGSFCVGWHDQDRDNRTTLFQPSSWRCEIVANVVFIHRTNEDLEAFDNPPPLAHLYTLVQTSR